METKSETTFKVSLKEVYERLIGLESKFDNAIAENKKISKPFWIVFILLFVFESINVFLNLFMLTKWQGL